MEKRPSFVSIFVSFDSRETMWSKRQAGGGDNKTRRKKNKQKCRDGRESEKKMRKRSGWNRIWTRRMDEMQRKRSGETYAKHTHWGGENK